MPRRPAQRPAPGLVADYVAAHRNAWSVHHVQCVTSKLNMWTRYLAGHGVALVDADLALVSGWLAERRAVVGKATLIKDQAAVVGLYGWLDEEGELPGRNPCRALKSLGEAKPDPRRTPHITPDVYDRLLASFDRRRTVDCRNAAICSLMYRSGFRRSEVVRCDRDRLDLDAQVLQVWNEKSKRWDDAFLAYETRLLLARYLRRRGEDRLPALFVGTEATVDAGGRMTVDGVASMLDRRSKAIGHPLPAHAFRRAMAINAKADGMNDTTVQHIGRWDDPRMVARYQKNAQRDLARAEFHRLDPTVRSTRRRRSA